MTDPVVPATYKEWKDCITTRCGIPLTKSYIDGRLSETRDDGHPKTIEFMRLYGEPYIKQVMVWFDRAREEARS